MCSSDLEHDHVPRLSIEAPVALHEIRGHEPRVRDAVLRRVAHRAGHEPGLAFHAEQLARALRERGAERLRHHCEYVSHTEHPDHVLVKLRDLKTHEDFDVRTQYLVGCDGAGSSVRRAAGIEMEGEPVLSYSVGIYIRAPGLLKKHDKGTAERYIFLGEDGAWGQLTRSEEHTS